MNKKLVLSMLSSLGILLLTSLNINVKAEDKDIHSPTSRNYLPEEAKIIDQMQSVLTGNPPGKPRDYIKDYIPYPGNKYPALVFLPDSWYFPPIPHQGYIDPEDFYNDKLIGRSLIVSHRDLKRITCVKCHNTELGMKATPGLWRMWSQGSHVDIPKDRFEKKLQASILLSEGKVNEFFKEADIPKWFIEKVPGIREIAEDYAKVVIKGMNVTPGDLIGMQSPLFESTKTTYTVLCIDCHVRPGANEAKQDEAGIILPTLRTCAVCHAKQYVELLSEMKVTTPPYPPGRPSHAAGWISNVAPPWYASVNHNLQVGCDQCHNLEVRGCDSCHTRHTFRASDARAPKACEACHMGYDHPDAETFKDSKHGHITETQHPNTKLLLKESRPGADYVAPTCQYCHMRYKQDGETYVSHNMVLKAIWRMGTAYHDPSGKFMQKEEPLDMRVLLPKAKTGGATTMDFKEKRTLWINLCGDCHSGRFAETYLDILDNYMVTMNKMIIKQRKQVQSLYDEGLLPGFAEGVRGIDTVQDYLGIPWTLDYPAGLWRWFAKVDYAGTEIERRFIESSFRYLPQGYKGTAHGSPDWSWHLGVAQIFKMESYMDDYELRLRRYKNVIDRLKILEERAGIKDPIELTEPSRKRTR
jgi:hydroxylamine dehydrogenase